MGRWNRYILLDTIKSEYFVYSLVVIASFMLVVYALWEPL